MDDEPVGREAESAYRGLFSIVLADLHLFERLYGNDIDPSGFSEGLRRMGIEAKTRIEKDRFGTLALSAGQRKFVALFPNDADR